MDIVVIGKRSANYHNLKSVKFWLGLSYSFCFHVLIKFSEGRLSALHTLTTVDSPALYFFHVLIKFSEGRLSALHTLTTVDSLALYF